MLRVARLIVRVVRTCRKQPANSSGLRVDVHMPHHARTSTLWIRVSHLPSIRTTTTARQCVQCTSPSAPRPVAVPTLCLSPIVLTASRLRGGALVDSPVSQAYSRAVRGRTWYVQLRYRRQTAQTYILPVMRVCPSLALSKPDTLCSKPVPSGIQSEVSRRRSSR